MTDSFNLIIQKILKKLIESDFLNQSSADGIPWKKKKVPNGRPILVRLGKLRNSFQYNNTTVKNTVSYFEEATKARPVYPSGDLPPQYKKEIDKEIKLEITNKLDKIFGK